MSHYDNDRYEDRHRGHRDRGDRDYRREPAYEEDESMATRRGPKGSRKDKALVPRRRDSSESSIEEIPRGYIPGQDPYDRRRDNYSSKRPRSAPRGGGRYDDYDDYDRPRRSKRDKRRDYSSSSSSPSPRRRKSLGEQALGALGLGGSGAAALAGLANSAKSKSQDRGDRSGRARRSHRYSSSSSSRSRSRGRGKKDQDPREKMIAAAKAAVLAGGTEAWRMRKEPGGWAGPKGKRVLTAAIGAAGVNGVGGDATGTITSVIGGLAGNRLVNGSRDDERSRSRSRSRARGSRGRDRSDSRGGGGLASLGGAAALATAAAKAFQENRSKSKGRGRRDYSSSDDGRYGRRSGGKRSKSVSDYMRQGMGALGIGGNKDKRDTINRDPRHDSEEVHETGHPPSQHRSLHAGPDQGDSSSSDDDISSSEEDRERKKMGRKQLITAGLASVATIHAANNVYQSVHMRQVRMKEVREGDLTREEARKKKHQATLHNVAAVGVAALGVKSAYSEWMETKEARDKALEIDRRRKARRERRLLKSTEHDVGSSTGNASTHSGDTAPSHGHGHPPPFSAPPYANAPEEYRSSSSELTSDSSDSDAYYHQYPPRSAPQYPHSSTFNSRGYTPPSSAPPNMGPPPRSF